MFYPQAMTEIELVVPSKDMLAVTRELSGRGLFHQTDASYLNSEKELTSPSVWQDKATAYSSLEHRIQIILQTIGGQEGPPPTTEFEVLTVIENAVEVVEQIEGEVKKITDRLTNETKKLEQLESNLTQLEPIEELGVQISALRNQRFIYSILGIMPTGNIDRLHDSLSRIPFVFLTLRQDNQRAVVWIASARTNAEILDRAIRSAYLIPLVLPDTYHGTPAEIIKMLHENIDASRVQISELKKKLSAIKEAHEKDLQTLYWDIHSSRLMTDAIIRYGRLKYTYLIIGWTPSNGLDDLIERIKLASKETLIESYPTSRSDVKKDVPVALQHHKVFQSFQMLVTTYARPRYDELDPTLILAISFPIIYGAMFGDVGQGIVLALIGWLLASRKVKALEGLASLSGLILSCGISATLFGFLYGSVFGYEDVLPILWIRPIENIILILEIAVGAGIFMLSIGFLIGTFNALTAKDWSRLFFQKNGLPGLLLYWSILGFGGTALLNIKAIPSFVFIIIAILSAVVIMFSELLKHLLEGRRPLISDGVSTFAIQAFFEVFETLISFLSNSLSYVRIGAFAVAHGGLNQAIFILGGLLDQGHGVGYFFILIMGNLLIILFEGLIVGIQTMRLEYYEFFSKFFVGGGKRYEPLTLRPVVRE